MIEDKPFVHFFRPLFQSSEQSNAHATYLQTIELRPYSVCSTVAQSEMRPLSIEQQRCRLRPDYKAKVFAKSRERFGERGKTRVAVLRQETKQPQIIRRFP
jgi:hypothetical protein